MSTVALSLGILLLVRFVSAPLDKPVFGAFSKIAAGVLGALYAAYIVFLGIKAPLATESFVGQTFGVILVLLIFVAIGSAVRKRKTRNIAAK